MLGILKTGRGRKNKLINEGREEFGGGGGE